MSKSNKDEEFTLDFNEAPSDTAKTVKSKKFPTIRFLGKMLPVIAVIGAVSYGSAYVMANRRLNSDIEKTMQEIEKISAEVDKANAQKVSTVDIPQEMLDKAIDITVQPDDIPQELVNPDKNNKLQNDKSWYLVDTNGDSIGDAYWGITKDDIVNATYGKMYVYSYTDRQYIKHIIQKANPEKGIKEIYEMIPDPNQVIPPNVLVPAQFVNNKSGTVLDYDKLE